MGTATNAKIAIETGQELVDYTALADSGDRQVFNPLDNVLSGKSGHEPDVVPNGIVSGRNLVGVAASGSDDVIDIAAFTAYSAGQLHSVAATTDEAITRPASNVAKVNSVTMTSAGAIAVIAGSDSLDTSFSETRGAAGGPPEIPADSVELGQVRITSSAAAPITAAEIYQVVGQHTERYDYPGWETNTIGEGSNAEHAAKQHAYIAFDSALPAAHTGGTAKGVYARYYTPVLSDAGDTRGFQPAEKTASASSETYYGRTINGVTEGLGTGSFEARLRDGVADTLVANKNQRLTVKYWPDRNKTPYILTQGVCAISRSFPEGGAQITASVTVVSETASAEFTS